MQLDDTSPTKERGYGHMTVLKFCRLSYAARNWVNAQQSRLNWKMKVSRTADNAGITQSQTRNTKYRRVS